MSAATPTATPSPLPLRPAASQNAPAEPDSPTATRPHPPPNPPPRPPKLLLQISDLSDTGAQYFLSAIDAWEALQTAVATVVSHLYPSAPASPMMPGTRSVTLILRAMDGVAYTVAKDIDDDHKEIHLSTTYIRKIPAKRKVDEILGVITHEMVHCWQWSAHGSAPGGLVEGVADWVRLQAGLVPPHWSRERGGKWDAGYQRTGYFLDYLEGSFGEGSVWKINDGLRKGKYEEEKFWKALFGETVDKLWEKYQTKLEKELEVEEEPIVVEKHEGSNGL